MPTDADLRGSESFIERVATAIQANCPVCRRPATMNPLRGVDADIGLQKNRFVGHRQCPNPQCMGYLFCVWHGSTLIETYPPQRIEFDTDNIPAPILLLFR